MEIGAVKPYPSASSTSSRANQITQYYKNSNSIDNSEPGNFYERQEITGQWLDVWFSVLTLSAPRAVSVAVLLSNLASEGVISAIFCAQVNLLMCE